ncbi:MAG: ABC transporter ATP-binding protein [Gaiellales bacterium]
MAELALHGVTKRFDGGVQAVDELDLEIRDGEFVVLLGPSGCGKTTVLRMIAGLEEPSAGVVAIGGKPVNHVPAKDRNIAMVFQNYALYPQMTVRQNLGFSLRMQKVAKAEVAKRVDSVAKLLGLETLLDRQPRALSGGQRQRVAMGRAIVREPVAFLMDEPLSNLDAKLRISMRAALLRLHQRLETTVVYVTHDQTEAMTMGSRVAVMRDGKLLQFAEPQALYRRPGNVFVASFVGSPPMNLFEAMVAPAGDGLVDLVFGAHRLRLPATATPAGLRGPVVLGFRPEDVEPCAGGDDAIATLAEVVEHLGGDTLVHFSLGQGVSQLRGEGTDLEEDADAALAGAVFVARVREEDAPEQGAAFHLRVSPSRLHFFDVTTGERLDVT